MIQFTEENIWRACLKGDKTAFEKLYNRYYPQLYNYGCKFSSDKELIRDCIQNLFVKLIRNYQSLSDTSSVKGYLLKAFRNHLYDSLKAKGERLRLFIPCIDDLLLFEKEGYNFSKEKEQTEEIRIIQRAFLELSHRQQEIIYLYYIMEASHADIATALNITYQSSKNLLARSIVKLRKVFYKQLRTCSGREIYDNDVRLFSLISYDFSYKFSKEIKPQAKS
jgi:RNA polymerase sigma-70 factor (ECF subfamily)